jgi:hypothetical protein
MGRGFESSPQNSRPSTSNLLGRSIDNAEDITAAYAAAERAQEEIKVLAQARDIVAMKINESERRASNNKDDENSESESEESDSEAEDEEDERVESDYYRKLRAARNHEPDVLVIE